MSQTEKETISVLQAAIGKKYVLTDQQSLEFYSMDVYRSFEIPIAIVQPGSVEELQEVVKVCVGSFINRSVILALTPRAPESPENNPVKSGP